MKTLKQVQEMYNIIGCDVVKMKDQEGYMRYFIIDQANGNRTMGGKNIDALITTYRLMVANLSSRLQDEHTEKNDIDLFEKLERTLVLNNKQEMQQENDAQRLHTLELMNHLTVEENELLLYALSITENSKYNRTLRSHAFYEWITERLASKTAKGEYETLIAFKLYTKLALTCADEYTSGKVESVFTEKNIKTVGECLECLNRNNVLIQSLEI